MLAYIHGYALIKKKKEERKQNKKHNQKTENQPLCLLMELIRRKQNLKP